jgi:hypothetical protein
MVNDTDDDKTDVNIRIKRDTWRDLNRRKEPNDSFDDVLQRVLEEVEKCDGEEDNPNRTTAAGD